MVRSTDRVPALFRDLVDDAGLFPPARLPMPAALVRHDHERTAGNPMMTGRFVCTPDHVETYGRELAEAAVRIAVVVDASDPDLLPLLDHVLRILDGSIEAIELDATSLATTQALHDAIGQVQHVASATELYVEVGTTGEVQQRLATVAQAAAFGKFRCGGLRLESFPTNRDLANALVAAARLGLPWKATAGLHRAVRAVDPRDALVHHGFLNLLVAAEAATAGNVAHDVANLLASDDARMLVRSARTLSADAVARTRDSFVSFGSCDIREPLDDLIDLGLVEATDAHDVARSA